jgi:uncharacterized protein (DUF1499 family)
LVEPTASRYVAPMRKALKRMLITGIVVYVALLIFVQWKGGVAPEGLGLKDGALADCPDSPNCVCSECEGSHKMAPLKFNGGVDTAKAALKTVLNKNGIRIVEEKENYLHAVATTPLMRFKDDLEFLLDADAKLIRFRSASRLGKSDLGKNRARLNEIFGELRKGGGFD